MTELQTVSDRLNDAINEHDLNAIAQCYHPDAVTITPFGPAKGRAEIVDSWRPMFEAFPDLRGAIDQHYETGDVAIEEWHASGTQTGPLRTADGGEIQPTGRAVTFRGCDVAVIRNGLIVEHRVYLDRLEMMEQLGLAG